MKRDVVWVCMSFILRRVLISHLSVHAHVIIGAFELVMHHVMPRTTPEQTRILCILG
jgi:hypothetical protein